MPLSVRIQGLEAAQERLQPSAPETAMQTAIEQLGDELATPKGGGLGVQVNSLSLSVGTGLAVVESSLIWPRTTGQSWAVRSQQEGEAAAASALEQAGAQLEEAMA